MTYSLQIIVLEKCPYSIALLELFQHYNIISNIITVTYETKDQYNKLNPAAISTFPRVFLMNNKKIAQLVGGYTDTKNIIDIMHSTTDVNIIVKELNDLYPQLNKKIILRLLIAFKSRSK